MLVLVHEFGHFFTAKGFGIKVDEFGFGFPPKLFSFKRGETEYSFNLLPLGGFVKIFGESVDEANLLEVGFLDKEETPEKIELAERSLANKPKWQQAIVLFAGIFANFLLAWILFSVGFMSGLPTSVGSKLTSYKLQDVNLVIVSILPNSPAENAGLRMGDKIINIQGLPARGVDENNFTTFLNPETIKSYVVDGGGKEIDIGYIRGENTEVNIAKIIPKETNGEFTIGISMDEIGTAKLPFFSAFSEGISLTLFMTKNTAIGLFTLIADGLRGQGSLSSVAGPVGMVGIVGNAYEFGFVYLLSFTALISINLAIINLIPFPALDGGRLFFLLIEKIKGSRINPKIANTANMIGFGILILLMVVITYHDIVKLF